MKSSIFGSIAAQLLVAASTVSAIRPAMREMQGAPPLRADEANAYILSEADASAASIIERRADKKSPIIAATFDQLIDHENPELGTFKQRYWYNADYYNGPGSPVVLNAPGENAADGYTGYATNRTLAGSMAQEIGGLAIVIEHRYWGDSSPYIELTTETLQYLTLDNAMKDLTYFAQNVKFPFDPEGESSPGKAPWVLTGCSYSGALTAWIHHLNPGTFWVYHCSSAVVEVSDALWQYWNIVEEAMPRNCSADVQRVVRYMDRTFKSGNETKIQKLKARFGLEMIEDPADFMTGITGVWGQQNLQFYTGYNGFHQFCDYVERRHPGSPYPQPDEEGVGLCDALKGWAKWFNEVSFPWSCSYYDYWHKKDETACYVSHQKDSPIYTDTSVRNPVNRQWQWMLCNEPFKWWRAAPPAGEPRIISSFVTEEYYNSECALYFPPMGDHVVGVMKGRTTDMINEYTGGWDAVNTTRLMWANGELDPWIHATVSSSYRPGGPLQSTVEAPVRIMPKAAHCNDLILANAQVNPEIMKVYQAEVQNAKEWVADFYKEKNKKWPGMPNN